MPTRYSLRPVLVLAALLLACCARPLPPPQPFVPQAGSALRDRADQLRRDGRYLEALSFYRDIAMNSPWAEQAGPEVYKSMAELYQEYVGDLTEAAAWMKKYAAAGPDARDATMPDTATARTIGSVPGVVRVLIAEGASPVRMSSAAPIRFLSGSRELLSCADASLSADNATVVLQHAKAARQIQAVPAAGRMILIDGKSYQGSFMISAAGGRVRIVNQVPIEEYLCGVLPREMSASWPIEALKAQAVAARTYALYHCLLRRGAAYDVLATTASQVFGGGGPVAASIRRAVDETRGLVLTRDGRLCLALFHANSGGATESFGDIWGGSLAYLKTVPDPVSAGLPGSSWECEIPATEIAASLRAFSLPAVDVQNIIRAETSSSGRIKKLKIQTDRGGFFLSGNSFRLIVGPGKVKGTCFDVRRKHNGFVFTGRGYGHGAGMSQWGGRAMALGGAAFDQILLHYYPGAPLQKISQ